MGDHANDALDDSIVPAGNVIKWIVKQRQLLGGRMMEVTTPCFKCGVQFDEDGDRHYVGGKPCCSDCYYEALGDEMEKNPPINPHFVKRMEQRKKSRQ
jgi:hypothetical protein